MIKSFAIKSTGFVLAVLLAFSAAMLAGCGGSKNNKSSASSDSKSSVISASPKSSKGDAYAGDYKVSENNSNDSKSSSSSENKSSEGSTSNASSNNDSKNPQKNINGTITVKDYGEIEFTLIPEVAPITVENFTTLVKSGFYNGLTFHRIMEGFMIQGGDPLGNGTGGSDKKIKGEFKDNGVNNPLKHQRGVISMARSQDPNSASSQFFIVQEDSDFLDGQYAAFGVVTKGMTVVDKIAKDAKPTDNNGTIPKANQPIIEKIEIAG